MTTTTRSAEMTVTRNEEETLVTFQGDVNELEVLNFQASIELTPAEAREAEEILVSLNTFADRYEGYC